MGGLPILKAQISFTILHSNNATIMKKNTKNMAAVNIDGKEYPIKMTMGAMLRFKQETGKEVNDGDMGFSEYVTLIWCCIKSACAHEKVDFDVSLMEFADSIEAKDVEPVVAALFQSAQGDGNEETSEGDKEGN